MPTPRMRKSGLILGRAVLVQPVRATKNLLKRKLGSRTGRRTSSNLAVAVGSELEVKSRKIAMIKVSFFHFLIQLRMRVILQWFLRLNRDGRLRDRLEFRCIMMFTFPQE
jgi:hypothetical protein